MIKKIEQKYDLNKHIVKIEYNRLYLIKIFSDFTCYWRMGIWLDAFQGTYQ